jgi:hypothetical protein
MSRTAGLGSGDYVAVNPVAVTSLVFGIAAALVIVDSLFVVLPVVGLILGIMAWRQVRQSNGTQTGGIMAVLAILLSLLFLGAKVGKEAIDSIRLAADKQTVSRLIETLGQDLSNLNPANMPDMQAHLASAYDMFDEAFKTRIPASHFDGLWTGMRQSQYYGALTAMHSNGLLKFDTDTRSGDPVCTAIAIAEFKMGEAPRWTMTFRQLNGKWMIEDVPDLFPPPQPAQQQRR